MESIHFPDFQLVLNISSDDNTGNASDDEALGGSSSQLHPSPPTSEPSMYSTDNQFWVRCDNCAKWRRVSSAQHQRSASIGYRCGSRHVSPLCLLTTRTFELTRCLFQGERKTMPEACAKLCTWLVAQVGRPTALALDSRGVGTTEDIANGSPEDIELLKVSQQKTSGQSLGSLPV